MFAIYKFANRINKKVYIGQTSQDITKRIRNPKYCSNISTSKFPRAIKKYGLNCFDFNVLCYCDTLKESNYLEICFIEKYNSFKNGYNTTAGGDGHLGVTLNDKWKKKLSESKKGKKKPEGFGLAVSLRLKGKKTRPLLEETKSKISEANKGKYVSQVTRNKLSKALKNRLFSRETREKLKIAWKTREKISEETRQRMILSKTGRVHSKETKLKMSLAQRGIKSAVARLTENQVLEIRKLRNEKKIFINELARMFNVSRGCIIGVVYGANWKHLLNQK